MREISAEHQVKSSDLVDGRLLVMNKGLKLIHESFHNTTSGIKKGIDYVAQDNNRAPVNSTNTNLYQ